MKKIFIACALLVIAIHSLADEWFKINETDESRYYINIPSISETKSYGEFVRSWIK